MIERLGILCILLIFIIAILIIKIIIMRKVADEICSGFAEKLHDDTNTLIDITSRDNKMRRLTIKINEQLKLLRRQRQRYLQGDLELKEAITNISHDIRTPLTAICGYLDLLREEDKSDTVSRYLSMIENRTAVLNQLTEELFQYSIVTTSFNDTELEEVVLNHILEESIISYFGALKEKNITPNISITEKPIRLMLNHSTLTRIFGNILTNAIKYSDGDLTIVMNDDGKITFSNKADKLNAIMVERLFDRFYTVETGRNSTGLGLSIARNLVEKLGGTINAYYNSGNLLIQVQFKIK